MRLIKGRELSLAIQEYHADCSRRGARGRQQLLTLLEHLVGACNTVAYAHDVGIIHCDIKPSNIMIGRYGETFVLDWGLAASFERTTNFFSSEPTMHPRSGSGSSASGQRGGTPGYISPEQLSPEQSIGPASDVYSLGATLYEILTGVPPFNGRDKDVADQIRSGSCRHPRELKNDIPWRLAEICRKAMSLRPADRYATAKQLAADLTSWMRDEEVQAAPDRWPDRLARLSRRHRALTVVTLVFAIALAASLAWIDRTRRLAAHADELRELEAAQTEQIENSFTTALDTIEDMCSPLASGDMNNLGVYRPFADRIERFTNVYLEKFEKTDSMAVHTGRVYELRAIISRVLTSDTSQALRHYQRSEEIYQSVKPDDESDATALKRRLAHIHLSLGRLHILRQEYRAAEDMLGQARESFEKFRGEPPDDRGLQRDLAEVYHSLGEVFLERDADSHMRFQALRDSRENFEKSRALRQELMENSRGSERSNYERDLARSHGYLGDLCLAQGAVPEAVENYVRSRDYRRELYKTNPTDPEYRFQLARGLGNFGSLERDFRGNLAEALEEFQEVRDIQTKLADDFPEVERFRRDLGGTLNALAEIWLLEAGRHPDKKREFGEAARQAAEEAIGKFSEIIRHNHTDADGVHGLAQSYVALAIFDQSDGASGTSRHSLEAEQLLLGLPGGEPMLGRAALVTLAMCRSLQNQPEAAWRTLKAAVDRGENTVNRFERHRSAAFRALAEDPQFGRQLDDLCRTLKTSLGIE
jgi:serine/threonine-protein kinase